METVTVNGKWRDTPGLWRWTEWLSHSISNSDIPSLDGPLLYIASDYSGYQPESDYVTTSLLVADLWKSPDWEILRRQVRARFRLGNRRISYKSLNQDSRRRSSLPYFLDAADHIEGLLITFVLSKRTKNLVTSPEIFSGELRQQIGIRGSWNKKQFENMLRVVHFICFLIGGLGKNGQDIYWISDEDDIFANEEKHADVANMLGRISNIYVRHRPGQLGVGTAAIDPGDRGEEDLIAVADLAAGAIAEAVTMLSRKDGYWQAPKSAPIFLHGMKRKTDAIIDWLWSGGGKLKRLAFVFDAKDEKGKFRIMKLNLYEPRIIY